MNPGEVLLEFAGIGNAVVVLMVGAKGSEPGELAFGDVAKLSIVLLAGDAMETTGGGLLTTILNGSSST